MKMRKLLIALLASGLLLGITLTLAPPAFPSAATLAKPKSVDLDVTDVKHPARYDVRATLEDTPYLRHDTIIIPPLPPTGIVLTGPYVGQSDVPYTFTAATPLSATLPLTFTWEVAAQTTLSRAVATYTDALSYTWPLTGTYAITVTAGNDGGDVAAKHTIVINPAYNVYLPLALHGYPPGPHIIAFYADVEIADPGQAILLTWVSDGATRGTLYHLLPTGQIGNWWNVPPSGSMPYTIPTTRRGSDNFWLHVYDDAQNDDDASLSIPLTCPDTWFFEPAPDECPSGPPLYSAGAEQHFEHGVMLWVGDEDRIYVLYDDGDVTAWNAFTDEWNEGDPIDDPSIVPPSGFYQPLRGFGLVWREQPGVRDRLGWAKATEMAYTTAIQRTARWKYNDTYIRAYDGGTWRLGPERSEWEYLPVP